MNTDRFKFRIWHDTQGMIYPDGIYIRVSEDKVMKLDPSIEEPRYFIMPLQDYDIMQCTGLKDSEGKLIYEGDLISNNFGTDKQVVREIKQGQEEFKGCWIADRVSGKSRMNKVCLLGQIHLLNFKVIGNIYENPELADGHK